MPNVYDWPVGIIMVIIMVIMVMIVEILTSSLLWVSE